MTWSTSATIPANETFEPSLVTAEIDAKYTDDANAAFEAVGALDDSFDTSKPRTVTFSGYRSGTTNSFTVGVTGTPAPTDTDSSD